MSRPLIECDTECFHDYWLCKFYDERTGRSRSFGTWPGSPLDVQGLADVLARVTIVTFNGNWYDIQMIVLALHGADTAQLKEANDDIIVRKMTPWAFRDKWRIATPDYIDHIDLAEVAPGVKLSLKMLMGRCHAPLMQDLPFDPMWVPGPADRMVLDRYCGNDLQGTNLLRHEVADRLRLRMSISEQYGVDVRSKSDAQIAEAVFKAKLDFEPQKRYVPDGFTFQYLPPGYLAYATKPMQELLDVVRNAQFVVRDKEESLALWYATVDPDTMEEPPKIRTGVKIPKELSGRDIILRNGKYRLGIGGLHSQESSVSYYSGDGYTIRDIDVKSYYPSLILTMGMVPQQIGEAFLIIYRAIYDRRLLSKSEAERIAKLWEAMGAQELKDEADALKTDADGLKIVLNGVFGKLFSKWSIFFAPELGIRVTLTGQLDLLMLIEMMELSGIEVVSANTDGIVLKIPTGKEALADQIVAWWEKRTGLEMEATEYRSIHFRDVNNYVAITTDGKAKRKGVFAQGGVLSGPQGKNPRMDIAADAVVEYLKKGTPLADTIRGCSDIRKFVAIAGVTGGGYWVTPQMETGEVTAEPVWLGKACRFYYGINGGRLIRKNGDQVAGSVGAVPIMDLPDRVPIDIDFNHYIAAAQKLLDVTGARQ